MKKFLIIALTLLLPLQMVAQDKTNKAAEHRFNSVNFTALAKFDLNGGMGVSAPFAGIVGDELLVAGGCNFTGNSAVDGTKTFYKDVYALANPLDKNAKWRKVGELAEPLAYGVSIATDDGLLCIGGTADGKTSSKKAVLLSLKGGKLQQEALPDLPAGIDQAAGAFGDGFVYVAAGQTDGKASKKAWRLDMSKKKAWEALPDLPGDARVQPVAVWQSANVGARFYIFGGFDPEKKATVTDGLAYNPIDKTWKATARIATSDSVQRALVGAAAVSSGAAHVIFFGGVNKDVFEQAINQPADDYLTHPAEWYKFNGKLLVYHTVTNTWVETFDSPLTARAGSGVVALKDKTGKVTWIVVGGEEKPGVRSADVTATEMTYTAHFGWLNWSVLILYLLGMVYLGYYFMKRANNSSDDFFKGGGRIPWWAAGISIFATMLSAITYMSIPAKAYATDWTYYPMQICILIISFPVIKYYLPFFIRLNVTTAYEYLERRFNYLTRLMASVLFIVFMVARTALVIFLPSLAMTAVTGIDIYLCIVLMALITILYCTMGGVEAVVWGDVIQGIILVGGAILAALYLIFNTGENGASDFWQIATDENKFQMFVWSFDWKSATFWVVILGGLANNLISYTSDQTVIQRYLTTSDEKSAARGILTNGLMSVVVTIAFFTIGTGLYTFFKTHPAELDMTMAKGDAIFPFFMMSQLPAGVAGLLIAAVFAATMSTIASNINSISTAFTVDLWSRFRNTTDKGKVKTARYAGVCAGLIGMFIAILMAMVDIQSLLDYFNTILGLLSGAIGGLFIMGIFLPRIGARAALIGFLCGTATVFYMNYGMDDNVKPNFLIYGFVSMAVAVIVALLLSFVLPKEKDNKGLTWQTLDKEKK